MRRFTTTRTAAEHRHQQPATNVVSTGRGTNIRMNADKPWSPGGMEA